MDPLERLQEQLPLITVDTPLLTVSMDLGRDPTGQPTAPRLLRQAVDDARDRYGNKEVHVAQSLDSDAKAVQEAAETAISAGSQGLFYVGSARGDVRIELETPLPFRNSVRVGHTPWLVEFMRYRYLAERPACLVETDLHTMEVTRVQYGSATERDEVDWSEHALTQRSGRNAVGGRGGGGDGGVSGRHSLSRLQTNIERHRAQFADEAADQLERFIGNDDLVMVAGVDEARSQVINRLSERVRVRVAESSNIQVTTDENELVARMADLAMREQFARADDEAQRWLSGAYVDQAVGGLEAVLASCQRGQLGTLVLHEDAVSHLGTAADARHHETPGPDEEINTLLQCALEHSVECHFTQHAPVLEQQEGVIGVQRW